MKITVATVCFNSASTIENTIISVINQTYKDIEYIIVDGKSNDSTMDIIERYAERNGIFVISEPDKGLYDAMNKAADIATGDYILYMNSGDVFASDDAVEKVVPFLLEKPCMCYGNVIRIKNDGEHMETYHGRFKEMKLVLQGKMMCHQSMFTRLETMRKYRFDLDYSITADFDFLVRLLRDKQRIQYADVTISKVDNIEGISSLSENLNIMRNQDDRSLKVNFPMWYYVLFIPKGLIRLIKK